jgi:hypothetical protein
MRCCFIVKNYTLYRFLIFLTINLFYIYFFLNYFKINLFAPEKLQSRVAVAEEVRPPQDSSFLGRKFHSGQDLEQGQQLCPVLQIVNKALHSEWRASLKANDQTVAQIIN